MGSNANEMETEHEFPMEDSSGEENNELELSEEPDPIPIHYIYEQPEIPPDRSNKFDQFPVAKDQYDLRKILEKGNQGIEWEWVIVEYHTDFYERKDIPDHYYSKYPVFHDLPNPEFTEQINQYIQNEFGRGDWPWYKMFGEYGTDLHVEIANSELVSISIFFPGASAPSFGFAFNPTTGERYRIHNFFDVSPECYATITDRPTPQSTIEKLRPFMEKHGLDEAVSLIYDDENEETSQYISKTFEDSDVYYLQRLLAYYKNFYNKVDTEYASLHYSFEWEELSWIEPSGLWIRIDTLNLNDEGKTVMIPFQEIEPFLHKDES